MKLTEPQQRAMAKLAAGRNPYFDCPIRARGALTNVLWRLRQKGLVIRGAACARYELTDCGREALSQNAGMMP